MRPVTPSGPAVRRRAVAGVGIAVAAALGLTACGDQPSGSAAAQAVGGAAAAAEGRGDDARTPSLVVRLAQGAQKPRLQCPTAERSLMIADFAVGATGPATPEDAVGLSSLAKGEQMVVGPGGTSVWILRPDGTAREKIDLIRAPAKGWLLHMREACA